VVLARQATQPGGISPSKSILRLLKSLKIRAQASGHIIKVIKDDVSRFSLLLDYLLHGSKERSGD
jgi:hypothetical protein